MKIDLNECTIAVTGGAGGIGRGICEVLRECGGEVYSIDIASPGSAFELTGDVSDEKSMQNVFRELKDRAAKSVTDLVCCHGVQTYGTVEDTDETTWDKTLDVNAKGVWLASKQCILQNGTLKSITVIGSVQSVGPLANSAAYVTSKHAVLGLTRSMAVDLAPATRVNCVMPGTIDIGSPEWWRTIDDRTRSRFEAARKGHLLDRIGKPVEVGNLVAFLTSELASFITGAAITVDGGLSLPLGGRAFQEFVGR